MKATFISQQKENKNLVVFFLGWSCDGTEIQHLDWPGYDLMAVYDYRDLCPCETLSAAIDRYSRVCVVAWSFGVWAADCCAPLFGAGCKAIAVNGTGTPIDNLFGIPERIFSLTLRSIRTQGIDTFNKRVYGMGDFSQHQSRRNFEEQYEELERLAELAKQPQQSRLHWDRALIGTDDLIFPVQNMADYWEKNCNFAPLKVDMPHYPFGPVGSTALKHWIDDPSL